MLPPTADSAPVVIKGFSHSGEQHVALTLQTGLGPPDPERAGEGRGGQADYLRQHPSPLASPPLRLLTPHPPLRAQLGYPSSHRAIDIQLHCLLITGSAGDRLGLKS